MPTINRTLLQEVMDSKGFNARSLSIAARLGETAVNDIITGKSKNPRSDTMAAIANVLKISVDMLHTSSAGVRETAYSGFTPGEIKAMSIPLYNAAMAPGQSPLEIIDYWPMPRDLIRQHTGAPAEKLGLTRVMGESMLPDYAPGQIILVDLSQTRGSHGSTYVIVEDDFLVVRSIEFVNGNPDIIRLISKNPAYPATEKPSQQIQVIGRVLAKWTWA